MNSWNMLKKQLINVDEKEISILLACAITPFVIGKILGWHLLVTNFFIGLSITGSLWYFGKVRGRFENLSLTFLKTFGLFTFFAYATVWFGLLWGTILVLVVGLGYRVYKVRHLILLWWRLTKSNIENKWRNEK